MINAPFKIAQPIIGSCEHNPLLLCQTYSVTDDEWPEPPPSATSVVDAAIEMFASLLPLQDSASCKRAITDIVESTRSSKLEKNFGRKAAVLVNSTIAVALALRAASTTHARHCRETIGSSQIASILSSFLKVFTCSLPP